MISFSVNYIYNNDEELFIGYTGDFNIGGFYEDIPKKMASAFTYTVRTLAACECFEDFPLAMKQLNETIGSGVDSMKDYIYFKPLAELLSKRAPISYIDFGFHDNLWNTDYILIRNDSDKSIKLITEKTRTETILIPGDIVLLEEREKPMTYKVDKLQVPTDLKHALLYKEVSCSTS